MVTKQTLAHWVSLGLKRALTPRNIQSGFRTIDISPFNKNALNGHFGPNAAYSHGGTEVAAAPTQGQ
jgi:hypothetical protein